MSTSVAPGNKPCLDASHVEDLKLAASKLLGSQRRSFQAAMTPAFRLKLSLSFSTEEPCVQEAQVPVDRVDYGPA